MSTYGKPSMSLEERNKVMSQAYWDLWNPQVQSQIDQDIEQNRKADGTFTVADVPVGADVKVEQLTHDFIFGAHIFNFDQLGTDERNTRYKDLYGTLFNSATIAFYWKKFELEEGKPRFAGEYRDTAEYWNSVKAPKDEPHWRRPATDPIVEFCESKGIRLHGHTLTWGNSKWNWPEWLMHKLPYPYNNLYPEGCNKDHNVTAELFADFTPAQLEQMFPEYVREMHHQMMKRIVDIALRYKGRLHSWDVVNESADDVKLGRIIENDRVCKSRYGLMPGDYPYRSFKVAEGMFPNDVLLNINDYSLSQCYVDQTKELMARNCKIDVMGAQMHLFNPQQCLDIAAGAEIQTPEHVRGYLDCLSQAGLPIHMSEITITSAGEGEKGEAIQATIARNLYRLWFSHKMTMGITWWNVVDDCGAPGEPTISGLFKRDMEPKLAYYALNDLIHNEWKTNTEVKADNDGKVEFRGFRGKYRLTWTDAAGNEKTECVKL